MKDSRNHGCDPGHDDAITMILACASDKLDVKAITTVGGEIELHVKSHK